jgi:hypothetical protein
VFDTATQTMPWMGHELADAPAFSRALDALDQHAPPAPDKLAGCRARLDEELTAQLQRVDALLANGKRENARRLLEKIDTRYGGLAAPRSIDLMKKIEPRQAATRE